MWGFNPKVTDYTYSQIIQLLPREIVDNGFVQRADKIYQVPKVESLAYIMAKVPSWKYGYIPEKRDCDDFCRIFRGWLSKKGIGNLLAMETTVRLPDGDKHYLISFMDIERKDQHGKHPLIFGEPQTGKLISSRYKEVKLRL